MFEGTYSVTRCGLLEGGRAAATAAAGCKVSVVPRALGGGGRPTNEWEQGRRLGR